MGPVIAGAAMGARGLAAYLAKKKAKDMVKKSVMKTGYGGSNATKIHDAMVMSPRAAAMASARGRVYPDASRFVSTQGSPSVFAKRLGLMGLATGAGIYGADSLINHPRNEAMNKMRGGDFMANPMMGKSHDPSYEASLTREGQVQTMMEEMDGMDISEEGKRRIIQDKLGAAKTGLEKNWRGYYPDQKGDNPLFNPDTLGSYPDFEASEWELNIMKKLRQIDGMNLTPEAKDLLKKDYIGSQTGAAMTEEEVAEIRMGPEAPGLKTWMGMPRGR
jgi:hypothetical protein